LVHVRCVYPHILLHTNRYIQIHTPLLVAGIKECGRIVAGELYS